MTMDYKEKYEQALERARTSFSYPDYPGFMRVDVIFPELQESEDEKIRKEIIDFFELPHHQFVGKRNHEKWIAWLENQGDTNETSSEWSEEDEQMITMPWQLEYFLMENLLLEQYCMNLYML